MTAATPVMSTRVEHPRAPRWPALVAASCAVVAVVTAIVALAADEHAVVIAATVTGYALGALGVGVFANVYRAKANRARQHPEFRPTPMWPRLVRAALVAGVVAGLVDAFLLATELAK
ncbi:hypothetical protein ACFT5B_19010 [Luteimicrobium sp. NPDC057192]|uniref:hypothetical protein n=1 Tax=Luteimicrobium sp. NPDC057192 TaxID=3346042 RepID=UPI003633A03A